LVNLSSLSNSRVSLYISNNTRSVLSVTHTHTHFRYENLNGQGDFGPPKVVSDKFNSFPISVYSVDVDGDGDNDVLGAFNNDGRISWFENDGKGEFSEAKVITDSLRGAFSVFAIDLNGDGAPDAISGSTDDNKVAW